MGPVAGKVWPDWPCLPSGALSSPLRRLWAIRRLAARTMKRQTSPSLVFAKGDVIQDLTRFEIADSVALDRRSLNTNKNWTRDLLQRDRISNSEGNSSTG